MSFPPKENIVFKTRLKPDVVAQRLFKICSGPHRTYEGQVNKSGFEIKRVITGRNSWLPQITGLIKGEPGHTIVEVGMRMNTGVTVFMWIWMCLAGIAGLGYFIFSSNIFAAVPAIAAILGLYFISTSIFKQESDRSKNELRTLFEAEVADED